MYDDRMKSIQHNRKMQALFRKYGVRFAYLFGSRATGQGLRVSSDYDFAVFFGTGTPRVRFAKRLKLMQDLQEIVAPGMVDLLVLDDTRSTTLRYSVISEGKVIYARDSNARIDFEFRTMHEYEDFSPFLRMYNEMYLANI